MRAAGLTPRENHYAFLFREAAGRGAYEEYFSRLQEMVDEGVKPRLRSYAPLLRGLCSKVRVLSALLFAPSRILFFRQVKCDATNAGNHNPAVKCTSCIRSENADCDFIFGLATLLSVRVTR